MNNNDKSKKYSTDKIALLGLFAASLFIANFIVSTKSAIILSKPVELANTGLSVAVPVGNGWGSTKKWQFNEDSFVLNSFFSPSSRGATARVLCRYLLASEEMDSDAIFERKALDVDGSITKTGQIQFDAVTLNWVYIEATKSLASMIVGVADLPYNRRLDIEIIQTTGEHEMIERVFKKILANLDYKENQLLKVGSEIVSQVKNIGVNRFVHNKYQQNFFLIKDTFDNSVGFSMDALIDSGRGDNLNIQSGGFFYFKSRFAQEEATFFKSDNSFDQFNWKSEFSNRGRKSGNEIVLSENEIVTVKTFDLRAVEKQYHINPATVPYVLLEAVFSQMLADGHKEIVIDVIKIDGKIAPMFISMFERDSFYVFKMESLDEPGFYEEVYLDGEMRIVKKLVKHQGVYTLERSSLQQIINEFPERADFVLQRNEMLKYDRL